MMNPIINETRESIFDKDKSLKQLLENDHEVIKKSDLYYPHKGSAVISGILAVLIGTPFFVPLLYIHYYLEKFDELRMFDKIGSPVIYFICFFIGFWLYKSWIKNIKINKMVREGTVFRGIALVADYMLLHFDPEIYTIIPRKNLYKVAIDYKSSKETRHKYLYYDIYYFEKDHSESVFTVSNADIATSWQSKALPRFEAAVNEWIQKK